MKEYTVNIGGLDHTVLLTDEDAKRLGAKAVETVKTATKVAPAPQNKARSAANKES